MTQRPTYKLRLYIAGDGPNSVHARANLDALCQLHLADHHETEVIDVLRDPERAQLDGVFLTPMLVKLEPAPARRVVGSLRDLAPLLAALGLAPA